MDRAVCVYLRGSSGHIDRAVCVFLSSGYMDRAVCDTSEDPLDIWIGLYVYTSDEDPLDVWTYC